MHWLRRWWLIPLVALFGLLIKGVLLALIVGGGVSDALGDVIGDDVEYDGISGIGGQALSVKLSGPASRQQAAVAAAEGLDEVESVSYTVTDNGLVEPEPTPGSAAAASELKSVGLTLTATGAEIVLEGVVADDSTKAALVSEAVSQYGIDNVTDKLTVGGEAFTTEGGRLLLSGRAASRSDKDIWLEKGAAIAAQADLEPIDQITIASIAEALNNLFSLEPIQFDSGRATIRPESLATLEAAAEVIGKNPEAGSLVVVGHTDSRGSIDANQALSQARADAVKAFLVGEMNVDLARLVAEGRGESELKVDPEESDEDRQANRRIEWELTQ